MPTLNTILKELKNLPVDRLEDLYSIIHSFQANANKSDKTTKKILSFAGSFGDMPQNDYSELLKHTREIRNDLFDRDVNLRSLPLLIQTFFPSFFVVLLKL